TVVRDGAIVRTPGMIDAQAMASLIGGGIGLLVGDGHLPAPIREAAVAGGAGRAAPRRRRRRRRTARSAASA
ncbi:MAG: hypothetical protein AAFZ09_12125, partial [Pseudomonadota bacterium]